MEHPVAAILMSIITLIGGVHMILDLKGGGDIWLYAGIVAVALGVMNGLVAMGRMSDNSDER